jgi:L-ribulose-5-phosphate 3-epimerase
LDLTRRNILTAAAALPSAPAQERSEAAPRRRMPLAVSTYSYWHLKGPLFPVEKVISEAARIGFDGVEILHRQMESEAPEYINRLRRAAWERGLSFPMLSIHQDFVSPDAGERRRQIDHTVHCIELAARLGCGAVRINSGRWKTIPDFDELMKVKGVEPPLQGYTDKDAIGWVVESIEAALPTAAREGVVMALENRWGLTTDPRNLLAIHAAVNSPWLGVTLDTGNFAGDPYDGVKLLAPHASIVQAKTYYGDGEWYTLDLDYARIAAILRVAGFNGWVSLEMEGREEAPIAVQRSYALLRRLFA